MYLDGAIALSSVSVFLDVTPGVGDVATLAKELRTIRIGKLHDMMVENLAVFLARADLSSTLALSGHGIAVFEPIDHVQVVNVLFNDMIATEPIKVVPVVDLIFHFSLIGLAGAHPHSSVVPVSPCDDDIADRAILEPLDRFDISGFMTSL